MTPEPSPTACPGCGAVLAAGPAPIRAHPGASAACRSLFEVTLRGLRDEADADPAAAATLALADDVYDAQHPAPDRSAASRPVWQTTVADVAADLDVVDLPVLVEAWARTADDDRRRAATDGT